MVLGKPQATERSPSFIPPAPGNPTAPEFGVVEGPPQVAPVDPNRGVRTVPHGSGRNYPSRAATMPSGPPMYANSAPPPTLDPASSEHKRIGLWVALGAVLVLGAVAAAVVVAKRNQGAPPTEVAEQTAVKPAPTPLPPPSIEVRPSENTAPPPSVEPPPPAPPAGIKLEVTTQPAGATVTKNGFQVCDQTPCEVLAEPNENVELEAVKGSLRAKARVLAQRDQKVTMKLVGQARNNAPRLCEVEVDGLKILRPCR
jgi:hypothetical protein